MTKETVHIISHSHWDREWYLPWEEHRMRLVELFDDLFELFEKDPEFKSFHLDGQTIVLDDYLEIRPQNREKLYRYIQEGKLKIGPFFILQDDFLISSEANMRNTLLGHIESKKWGTPPKIGYYPDTFGNVGQVPQLLKQAGIDVAFFGRGVKPVGFDNQVLEDEKFQSQFSEMNWIGADGSQVLGILFANWYSNGNEIPSNEEDAKVFWEKKLADVRAYASTKHYLLMNGCDHQPVQKDLSKAIQVAKKLYPDIDFVHSNFDEYVKAVKEELPEDLSAVYGELTSQETDGWYTLTNTASSRIYLKQANDRASKLLEQVVEPMAVMTRDDYPIDELRYAWKLLLENAPHDSICGCSVDEVHREMETRFEKVEQVANFLAHRSFDRFEKQLNTQQLGEHLITVMNTTPFYKTQLVEANVILDKVDFRDGKLAQHYKEMEALPIPHLALYCNGEKVESKIEDLGVQFHYELPKDAFRSATFSRQVKVRFVVSDMAPFSWQTYDIRPIECEPVNSQQKDVLENPYVRIELATDGTLSLTNKQTQEVQKDFLRFEDTGDIGNEYIYMAPKGEEPIFAKATDLTLTYQSKDVTLATLTHHLHIPVSAEDLLEQEQKQIIEFKDRQAKRSKEYDTIELKTFITLYQNSPQVQFKTVFSNTAKDHRIRVIFKTPITSETNVSDSIYETVERNNHVAKSWQNPTNPQRHRSFVSLRQDDLALTVSSRGLHEYEILNNQEIALTILRSTGELGDWGYFPTPEAQCLRECVAEYAMEWHNRSDDYHAIKRAKAFQTDLFAKQAYQHDGSIEANGVYTNHASLDIPELCGTSLKRAEESEHILLRYYNLSNEEIGLHSESRESVNLLEEPIGKLGSEIAPQEIRTDIL
ncbi:MULTISPECIES: alpha-mannosidase [unclassified Granulicatella]|uniref:alpha-mannosidase n=1 Tax=unclassified Granulicatella TaxID=2630493 RepID=UPI0010743194|nr:MULTISPECIES: alpha-mannosidase [unclassified Granulicatella]MBF0780692.1 alpha-mannosidase [Granulicatella sp. 19428wC4_WM01]TFU94234.1 alpha-mannosidase [Granulicatella sp. WM01]